MKKQIVAILTGIVLVANSAPVFATTEISVEKKAAIVDHCDAIKENLRNVQRQDSRTRVYYGRHYETISSKFMLPLNTRLMENNLLSDGLLNVQTKFVKLRSDFSNDFIEYQKVLEELVTADCKNEPEKFYELLETARTKREYVNQDVADIRKTVTTHVELVTNLEGGL